MVDRPDTGVVPKTGGTGLCDGGVKGREWVWVQKSSLQNSAWFYLILVEHLEPKADIGMECRYGIYRPVRDSKTDVE